MAMERSCNCKCKVCVTGATGYVGSWLVNKLLGRGYTVHATLRDLKNESKVGLLKSFPQAEGKLVLFEADIYNPTEFVPAIQGCDFVFHVATPLTHQAASQYNDTTEAALAASKSIVTSCVRAGTLVRRLIYTASVVSASPLKVDAIGFKDFMDETCWTPFNDSLAYVYHDDFHKDYTYSKTLTEKYMLSYGNNENDGTLEVVTIACGLVGGDTHLSFTPSSVAVCISQLTEDVATYQSLKFLRELLGKIPLVHIDDVCEAHIFCIENTSISTGRFLCASSYISLQEIAKYFVLHHPEFNVKQERVEGLKSDIKWASTKLCDKGFVYKYDARLILEDCIKCARRMGDL